MASEATSASLIAGAALQAGVQTTPDAVRLLLNPAAILGAAGADVAYAWTGWDTRLAGLDPAGTIRIYR